MANNELSTEMRELNKKMYNAFVKFLGEQAESWKDLEPELKNFMIDMYANCFNYMQLSAKIIEQQETLNEKLNKALDIYIQKNGE